MNTNFCKVAVALAWLVCIPTYAGDEPVTVNANIEAAFKKYDVNRDGYLSKQEVKGRRDLLRIFADADTDHDGKLNLDEYAAAESALHWAKAERCRPWPRHGQQTFCSRSPESRSSFTSNKDGGIAQHVARCR